MSRPPRYGLVPIAITVIALVVSINLVMMPGELLAKSIALAFMGVVALLGLLLVPRWPSYALESVDTTPETKGPGDSSVNATAKVSVKDLEGGGFELVFEGSDGRPLLVEHVPGAVGERRILPGVSIHLSSPEEEALRDALRVEADLVAERFRRRLNLDA